MGERLCTCTLCGPEGESRSISTTQRHQLDDRLRSGGSSAPTRVPSPQKLPQREIVSVCVDTSGADSSGSPNTPNLLPPSVSTSIDDVVYHLHTCNAAWSFPTSLVFEIPPTKDSFDFTPKAVEELRCPNSAFRLSLRDQESARVVGYECFLNEALQVLESHLIDENCPTVARIAESIDKILDILTTLDKQKGNEWDRQLRAQRSPNTYVLTGACVQPLFYLASYRFI